MKTITGVPESITREQYVALVESIGFDPAHLRSLEFRTDGIYAQVMDLKDGHHYVVDGTNELAVHTVFVPVKDDADA